MARKYDILDYTTATVPTGSNIYDLVMAMARDDDGANLLGDIQIPGGRWVWDPGANGKPLDLPNMSIRFRGPMHTQMTLKQPFIKNANQGALMLEDVGFFGGDKYQGTKECPIQISWSPDYGGRDRILGHIEFDGTTGGIAITGADNPYYHIHNIVGNVIGDLIVMNGTTDGSCIEHIIGRQYRTLLRFQGQFQRMTVRDVQCLHVEDRNPAGPQNDIHIVPSTSGTSKGGGITFTEIHHGNEGRGPEDRFIVIADVAADGSPIVDKPSKGWLGDVAIFNTYAFMDYPNVPYMFTTTDLVDVSRMGWLCGKQSFLNPAPPFLRSLSKKLTLDWEDRELVGFTKSDRDNLQYLRDQFGPGFDIWGADGDLGRNATGQRRTMRTFLAALRRKFGVPDG